MQLKNKIINYYVGLPSEGGGNARVFRSPITINDRIARDLINKQLKTKKQPQLPSSFPLLHVCYDFDSSIIYLPNSHDFTRDQINILLSAAKLRITNDFGGYANRPPIEGSPFSSLRVRSINSFGFARKIISEHFKGKVFKDMPVLEVFLDRMPRTLKTLPPIFRDPQYLGGYIGPKQLESVTFVDDIDINGNKRKESKTLLTQRTPFILINTSVTEQRKEPSATEKEWVVIEGYRTYLYDGDVVQKEEKYITEDLSSFADLYAIKRQLYAGHPFEEVCTYLLDDAKINNFGSLMKAADRLMTAAISLTKEGHKNPAEIPYYISFQIGKDFPYNITGLINDQGRIETESQHPYFILMDYDTKNSSVLIRTPIYIPPHICKNVLKAKDEPLITHYNPIINKIDVKGEPRSYTAALQERNQLGKIKSIVGNRLDEEKRKTLNFRVGDMARGRSSVDPTITTIRRISDYPMACDFIKKICKEYGVEFKDVDVVIGPMEQILGQGIQGGFMDAKLFRQNKMKIPYELVSGIWISPPVIMVNSVEHPSYAEQTDTLSHEYTHNIYSILHPEYSVSYNMGDKGDKPEDEYKHWFKYFTDPSEIEAHKVNIRFELGLGKSYDEIIRNKVGGAITLENYPIALKFAQLVKEVMEQMEREEEVNEEPTGEH